ncbi:hypothetical protein COV56_00985 [Candidatus Kuenenbacteria bacterium CG11_big_fil_rev_8_21_14_0_20_37_9]|uniref:ATP-grasp fold RimK-type domain-containing protein n=1 Tax=Candidatus Kuenenbacteria bacterium CG08_land_8_20_14_0_20_37_23 TaxID=1974617 RepID=A0A2M6XSB3_9BACT|nr:MAG: hypothetical protein COV56_00985 [Candidatus Kuenenbacteria bacterium CG11_big_fil_rev_8_21_14_0_20_37_9]PIU10459.1 MAG: hypothetical protein COT27_03010 [Candidatus Kuenenbacteria bacterium CG08_land_8_20_14_0_20_37_23]
MNSGSLGYKVSVFESHISFISFMEFMGGLVDSASILIQPFINAGHEDHRLIVVGDRVIAAMKRKARGIEFRSNISKGGIGIKFKPTKPMVDLAIRSTKILGLDYAGVDIIEEKEKMMIVEVNANPGLEIEKITGVNIVKEIIQYGIKKVR